MDKKQTNITTYKDTLKIVKNIYDENIKNKTPENLPVSSYIRYNYNITAEIVESIIKSKKYDFFFEPFKDTGKINFCNVSIFNNPTLHVAKNFSSNGFKKILVLNLSNFIYPGSSTPSGSQGQEEHLYRCTNIYSSLPCYDSKLCPHYYPIFVGDAVLTNNVTVFKDEFKGKVETLTKNEWYNISILNMSAVREPEITKNTPNGKYIDKDIGGKKININKRDMENAIERIFVIALSFGYTCLVLGGFGCGAYANPSKEVANMFVECIKKYYPFFKEISFAISGKDSNFDDFRTALDSLQTYTPGVEKKYSELNVHI